jgi:hypothetical protein
MSKGKARVGEPVPDHSGPAMRQRLLEGVAEQPLVNPGDLPTAWLYSTASAAVASFLYGPALPPDELGEVPRRLPVSRPRLDIAGNALTVSMDHLDESLTSHHDNSPQSFVTGSRSGTGTSTRSSAFSPNPTTGWSTLATTPASSRSPLSESGLAAAPASLPFAWAEPFETAPSRPDPFAYIDNAEPPNLGLSPPTPVASMATTWGADAPLFAHPLFAGDVPSHLTRPVPPHTHAYVSFGAGARQKDVDQFTAEHPLGGSGVPYHVPLCVGLP